MSENQNIPAKLTLVGPNRLNFAYGQILVFDQVETEPGSLWTDQHVAQGFVRRTHTLAVGTLLPSGEATLSLFTGTLESVDSYDRVVSIPLQVDSGVICVEGPDEYPIERFVVLPPGFIRVVAAQRLQSETKIVFDLYFCPEANPNSCSKILKADKEVLPSEKFLENGDIA